MGGLLDPDAWWDQVEQRLEAGDAAAYLFAIALLFLASGWLVW